MEVLSTDPLTSSLQISVFLYPTVWKLARTVKGFGLLLRMHETCINTEQEQDAECEADWEMWTGIE